MKNLADWFTGHRAVAAEGARIGLVTCLECGATITLDPADDPPADEVHRAWHLREGHGRHREHPWRTPKEEV